MRRQQNDSGQSLVEFALVLPVLALLLLGIIDFGRIISAYLTVSEAARDAARYASIGQTDSQIGQDIAMDTSSMTNVSWTVSPSGSRVSGQPVTVTVQHPVSVIDPLMAAIIGGTYTVTSSTTMRAE